MNMNIFDIVIAVLLLFGLVRGLMKGLFVEVASLVGLLAGVYGAIHFSYFVGDKLKDTVSWSEEYISLVAFAVTFLIILLAVALAGKLLTKIADFASLGLMNRILGGVFGALKIGFILSVGLVFFAKINSTIPFLTEEILENSILYKPVQKIAPTIFPTIFK